MSTNRDLFINTVSEYYDSEERMIEIMSKFVPTQEVDLSNVDFNYWTPAVRSACLQNLKLNAHSTLNLSRNSLSELSADDINQVMRDLEDKNISTLLLDGNHLNSWNAEQIDQFVQGLLKSSITTVSLKNNNFNNVDYTGNIDHFSTSTIMLIADSLRKHIELNGSMNINLQLENNHLQPQQLAALRKALPACITVSSDVGKYIRSHARSSSATPSAHDIAAAANSNNQQIKTMQLSGLGTEAILSPYLAAVPPCTPKTAHGHYRKKSQVTSPSVMLEKDVMNLTRIEANINLVLTCEIATSLDENRCVKALISHATLLVTSGTWKDWEEASKYFHGKVVENFGKASVNIAVVSKVCKEIDAQIKIRDEAKEASKMTLPSLTLTGTAATANSTPRPHTTSPLAQRKKTFFRTTSAGASTDLTSSAAAAANVSQRQATDISRLPSHTSRRHSLLRITTKPSIFQNSEDTAAAAAACVTPSSSNTQTARPSLIIYKKPN